MKRHEAILSIRFGGECGLAVAQSISTSKWKVGNIPSSPVASAWALDRDYENRDTAIKAAQRLARDAGVAIKEPEERRPGFFFMDFDIDNV